MSKRRRYMQESESESEPAAEEANGGESEEADEPYSTIWRAAGPLTMRQDMQHDSQVVHSLRTGDLVKQTKPTVTVHTQPTRATAGTLVRTKFLQLYNRQGTVHAYRAYKNRPSPKLT